MQGVICTYRFDINWLKAAYRDKGSNEYKQLTQLEKRVIDGVHRRDFSHGLMADKPSDKDYDVLNGAYHKRRAFDSVQIKFVHNYLYAWCNPAQVCLSYKIYNYSVMYVGCRHQPYISEF